MEEPAVEPSPTMEDPSVSDLASVAEASYGGKTPADYYRLEHLSNDTVSTYKHKKNPHYIISHKGTDIHSNTANKDLKSDLNILVGNTKKDKQFVDRTKKTEKIIKHLKKNDPNADIFMASHSLGGATQQHAMINSDLIRKNVKQGHTFNAGASLFTTPDIKKDSELYKELMDKQTHHRVTGDEISRHGKTTMIGKLKVYKSKMKPSIAQTVIKLATPILKKSLFGKIALYGANKTANTLQSHSLKHFIKK